MERAAPLASIFEKTPFCNAILTYLLVVAAFLMSGICAIKLGFGDRTGLYISQNHQNLHKLAREYIFRSCGIRYLRRFRWGSRCVHIIKPRHCGGNQHARLACAPVSWAHGGSVPDWTYEFGMEKSNEADRVQPHGWANATLSPLVLAQNSG